MKKIINSLTFFILAHSLNAQKNTLTTGGVATGSGGSASYSIGQAFYYSTNSSSFVVIEGLQQPNNTTPLPISLISFSAEVVNNKDVKLLWATASEVNNDHFVIEKSKDNRIFKQVTEVKSKGNSSKVETYQTFDNDPYEGVSFYRLVQQDVDGKKSYSSTVKIYLNTNSNELSAYPNPTTSFFTLFLKIPITKNLSYQICDLSGKVVSSGIITNEATTFNTSVLTKGNYILTVFNNFDRIKSFTITKL